MAIVHLGATVHTNAQADAYEVYFDPIGHEAPGGDIIMEGIKHGKTIRHPLKLILRAKSKMSLHSQAQELYLIYEAGPKTDINEVF